MLRLLQKAAALVALAPAAIALTCDDATVNWVWSGAMTSSSLRLRVSTSMTHPGCDPDAVQLHVTQAAGASSVYQGAKQAMGPSTWLLDFHATDLVPGPMQYEVRYGAGTVLKAQTGAISLPPAPGTPTSFEIAFSSCADQDSNPKVFETIAKHNPLFFLHMGDLHYDNIEVNDVHVFRNAYDPCSVEAMLNMDLPMAYMWDDHDFGPDNSDGTAPGREASLQAYREYVPHYPLQDKPGVTAPNERPVQQAFTIGRVRFLVTDLRSQRTPNTDPDVPTKTVLGAAQKLWFKQELLAASSPESAVGLIVWVNTMPWIDDERKWGHFKHEQAELVAFLSEHELNTRVPIVIASGDAHMLAVDDGSHSPGHLPTFHAAALGRPGSIKGGPYSHGAIPGSGHFGLMHFDDDGSRICVRYSGRNLHDDELLAYDTCHPVAGTAYYPPPIVVRQLTRGFRKLCSRAMTKWLRASPLELVALASLVLGLVALLLVRKKQFRQAKRD
ncbi:hypothetical protein SPRG_08211 [Saprolegnia parasitica CBS 223.65]|uniref:PhoD-like phosphatase metallophosphatase domain-containing protein n=1 Tax=Saprolegnia parasitica (strain CBS 223.65) TaxID=695850 RepID=A0A067C7B7_SAPPC|nr:hypothetical protein SPRG_08211 [Saprolegnia parasitica CBS 223.65]KDO26408.1 hypothetical protein SPRG_08211 [Saprolegnia parasitica CBS 223.65]|eukprot:XP_012202845.1 hypothetical protein SPRG_08211 [Saprolegnia parasitica CBS 223.65]